MSTKIHISLSHIDYNRIINVGQTDDGKPTYGNSTGWKYLHPVIVASVSGRTETFLNIIPINTASADASHTHTYNETFDPEIRSSPSNLVRRNRHVRRLAQDMVDNGNNVLFDFTQLSPGTSGIHPHHNVVRTTIKRVPPVPEENPDALQYRSVTYNNSYRDNNRIYLTNSAPIHNRDAFIYRNMGSINRSFTYNMNLPNNFRFRDLNGEFISNQAVLKNYSSTLPLLRVTGYSNGVGIFSQDLGFVPNNILSFSIHRSNFDREHLLTGGLVGFSSKHFSRIMFSDINSVTLNRAVRYAFQQNLAANRMFMDYPHSRFHGFTSPTSPIIYTVSLKQPTKISMFGVHTTISSWSPLVSLKLEASNNGTTWEVLREVFTSDIQGESPGLRLSGRRYHEVNLPDFYSFYRITVVGDSSTTRTYVTGIDLIKPSDIPELVSTLVEPSSNISASGILESIRHEHVISNNASLYFYYNKEFIPGAYSITTGVLGRLRSWKLYGLREEFVSRDSILGQHSTNTDRYELDIDSNLVIEVGDIGLMRIADMGVLRTRGKQYIEFSVENTIPSLHLLQFQLTTRDGSVYNFRAVNTSLTNIFHKENNGIYISRHGDNLSTSLGSVVATPDEGFTGNSMVWPLKVRIGILLDFDNNTISRYHDGEIVHRLKINESEFRNNGIATARLCWFHNSWNLTKQTVIVYDSNNSLYIPDGAYPMCQYRRGISDPVLTRNKARVEFKAGLLPSGDRSSLISRTNKIVDSVMYTWQTSLGSELEYDPLGFVTTSSDTLLARQSDIINTETFIVPRLEYSIRPANFYTNNHSVYVSHAVNIGAVIDYETNTVHRTINGEYIGSVVVPPDINLRLLGASVYTRHGRTRLSTTSYRVSGSVVKEMFPTTNSGTFSTNNSGNLVRVNYASYGNGFNTITVVNNETVNISMRSTNTAAISGQIYSNEVVLGKVIAEGSRRFGYVNINLTAYGSVTSSERTDTGIAVIRSDNSVYRIPLFDVPSNSAGGISTLSFVNLAEEINNIRRDIILNEGPENSIIPTIDANKFNSYIIKNNNQRHILHGIKPNGNKVLLRDYTQRNDSNFRTCPYLEIPFSLSSFSRYSICYGNGPVNEVQMYDMNLRQKVSYKGTINKMPAVMPISSLDAYMMLDKHSFQKNIIPLKEGEFSIRFESLTKVNGYSLKSTDAFRLYKWRVFGITASGSRVNIHEELDGWEITSNTNTLTYEASFTGGIFSEIVFDVIEVKDDYIIIDVENNMYVSNSSNHLWEFNNEDSKRIITENDYANLQNTSPRDACISTNGEFLVTRTNNIEYYRRNPRTGIFENRILINISSPFDGDVLQKDTVRISSKAPWIMLFAATHQSVTSVFSVNMVTQEITNVLNLDYVITSVYITEETNDGKFIALVSTEIYNSDKDFAFSISIDVDGIVSYSVISVGNSATPSIINNVLQGDDGNVISYTGLRHNRSENDGIDNGIIVLTDFSSETPQHNTVENMGMNFLPTNTPLRHFSEFGLITPNTSNNDWMVRIHRFWEPSEGHIWTFENSSNTRTRTNIFLMLDLLPTDISNSPVIITDNNYNEAVVRINSNGSIYYDYDNRAGTRATSAAGVVRTDERSLIMYIHEVVSENTMRGIIYVNDTKVIDHTFVTSGANTSGPEGDLVLLRGFRGIASSFVASNVVPTEEQINTLYNSMQNIRASSGIVSTNIKKEDGSIYENITNSQATLVNNTNNITSIESNSLVFTSTAAVHNVGNFTEDNINGIVRVARSGGGVGSSDYVWRWRASPKLVEGNEIVFHLAGSRIDSWSIILLGIAIDTVMYTFVINETQILWGGGRVNLSEPISQANVEFTSERYPENEHPERDFVEGWNSQSIGRRSKDIRFIPNFENNTIEVKLSDTLLVTIHSQVSLLDSDNIRGVIGSEGRHTGLDFLYLRHIRSERSNTVNITGIGTSDNSNIRYRVSPVINHNEKQVEFYLQGGTAAHSSRTAFGLVIDDTVVYLTVGDSRNGNLHTIEAHRHGIESFEENVVYSIRNLWGPSISITPTSYHNNTWIQYNNYGVRMVANAETNTVDVYNNSFLVTTIKGDFEIKPDSEVRGFLGDVWWDSTSFMSVIDRNNGYVARLTINNITQNYVDINDRISIEYNGTAAVRLELFPNNTLHRWSLPVIDGSVTSYNIIPDEYFNTLGVADYNIETQSLHTYVMDEGVLTKSFKHALSSQDYIIHNTSSNLTSTVLNRTFIESTPETTKEIKYLYSRRGGIVHVGSCMFIREYNNDSYVFGPRNYKLKRENIEAVEAISIASNLEYSPDHSLAYYTNGNENSVLFTFGNKTGGLSYKMSYFLTISTEDGFDHGVCFSVGGARSSDTRSVTIFRGRLRHSDRRLYTDDLIAISPNNNLVHSVLVSNRENGGVELSVAGVDTILLEEIESLSDIIRYVEVTYRVTHNDDVVVMVGDDVQITEVVHSSNNPDLYNLVISDISEEISTNYILEDSDIEVLPNTTPTWNYARKFSNYSSSTICGHDEYSTFVSNGITNITNIDLLNLDRSNNKDRINTNDYLLLENDIIPDSGSTIMASLELPSTNTTLSTLSNTTTFVPMIMNEDKEPAEQVLLDERILSDEVFDQSRDGNGNIGPYNVSNPGLEEFKYYRMEVIDTDTNGNLMTDFIWHDPSQKPIVLSVFFRNKQSMEMFSFDEAGEVISFGTTLTSEDVESNIYRWDNPTTTFNFNYEFYQMLPRGNYEIIVASNTEPGIQQIPFELRAADTTTVISPNEWMNFEDMKTIVSLTSSGTFTGGRLRVFFMRSNDYRYWFYNTQTNEWEGFLDLDHRTITQRSNLLSEVTGARLTDWYTIGNSFEGSMYRTKMFMVLEATTHTHNVRLNSATINCVSHEVWRKQLVNLLSTSPYRLTFGFDRNNGQLYIETYSYGRTDYKVVYQD